MLFTSTVGFAPTGVKIKGVSHEFDSLRGMLEDVALFIINLKNLRFKLKNDNHREVIEYSFKGSKEITGADLCNDIVEVVNPDAYLATLNDDAELNFSLIIQKGIGYVSSEDLRSDIDDEYIALDAFFTPVKKAVYDIENVLVEDTPDFEKIVFTITTDGQVKPLEAFKNALEAMYQQMSVFKGVLDIDVDAPVASASVGSEYSRLLSSVEELNLSARSFNCIDKAEIRYIGELALMDEKELSELKNLGKKSLDEIKAVMEEIGYPVGVALSKEVKEQLKNKIAELKTQMSSI